MRTVDLCSYLWLNFWRLTARSARSVIQVPEPGLARCARARLRQCFCLQRSIGRALHLKSIRSTARFGSFILPLQDHNPLRFWCRLAILRAGPRV
ncbi:hypothetical protein NDU88_006060 [Pleurodeles waltl]|uniref:Secreted protein n=1 Tax=Pleurodeles waltl TaxID=8319 RepID=A0AAV7WDQ0_PLEWA|nr:hypothetical protein NDU88_006060 [Pleurodeles waltl]